MILTFSYDWQPVPQNDLSLHLNIKADSHKVNVSG